MVNQLVSTHRLITALLLVIATGPYFSSWMSQGPDDSLSAQEFVLVDENGNRLALWTALDGHPRIEFLGRDGKKTLELGMYDPSRRVPQIPSTPEPHLSFYDTTNPEAGPQVAMALKKSGKQVSHTLYSVNSESSSPSVHIQSGCNDSEGGKGAQATFAGSGKGVSILNWERDGALKLLVGGGESGKGVTITISPEGRVKFSNGTLQKIVELFD